MMSTFATAASSIARTARATESSGVVAKGRLASAMRRMGMFPVYDLVAPSRHHDARCVAVIGSVGIAMREGVEHGFPLPRQVAIAPNDYGALAVEHLDDAAARKVEVLARV